MMEGKEESAKTELYHERQVKELCLLHALNNLFQKKNTFTKKELDDICLRLSPDSFINPHRSILGMGNYDVNVLMAALQEKGYETVWYDKRKDVEVLVMENVMGLILNTPTEYRLGFIKLPIHRKHWIAIRHLQGQYMNLDSKMDAPTTIGDEASLISFLRKELSDGDKELFLIVEPHVSEKALWKKTSVDYGSNGNNHSGTNSESPKLESSSGVVKDVVIEENENTADDVINNTLNGTKDAELECQVEDLHVKDDDVQKENNDTSLANDSEKKDTHSDCLSQDDSKTSSSSEIPSELC